MDPFQNALNDLRNANQEIVKDEKYDCGIQSIRKSKTGWTGFFLSPDGQNGKLQIRLIARGWKNAGYNSEYYWKVKKENIFISYVEGDINIYQKQ